MSLVKSRDRKFFYQQNYFLTYLIDILIKAPRNTRGKEPKDASRTVMMEESGSGNALVEALRLMLATAERLQHDSNGAISEAAFRITRCELAVLFLGARQRRAQHLPATLFGEPGWDMLLDLYVSYCNDRAISVSSICLASGVPATTALRYLSIMQAEGLIERRPDLSDKRRDFVVISDAGLMKVEAYLDGYSSWVINTHQPQKRN